MSPGRMIVLSSTHLSRDARRDLWAISRINGLGGFEVSRRPDGWEVVFGQFDQEDSSFFSGLSQALARVLWHGLHAGAERMLFARDMSRPEPELPAFDETTDEVVDFHASRKAKAGREQLVLAALRQNPSITASEIDGWEAATATEDVAMMSGLGILAGERTLVKCDEGQDHFWSFYGAAMSRCPAGTFQPGR